MNTGAIDPTMIARSPSRLAHIHFLQPALESEEEEGNERDELPLFHRGAVKSGVKKATIATISRSAPRPFPMQLAFESPVSPRGSRLQDWDERRHDDENDDGDGIEIVDVFTTPRGPSPPRSPTPSPSPVKPLPVHASVGPDSFAKSNQFPTSPTNPTSRIIAEPHEKAKPRRCVSPDTDTHVSGNERNGILKSPRKSAAHSSPRHISRVRGRASSPTPPGLSNSSRANDAVLWTGTAECMASDCRAPQPDDPGSTYTGNGVRRKPRPSDTSAIYISSGSEDEDNAELGIDDNREGGEAAVHHDWTDGWADTGMILSVPPIPARAPLSPTGDHTPPDLTEEALPNPARTSKFKPAPPALKVTGGAPPAEPRVLDRVMSTSLKGNTHDDAPRPVHRAPLLVARAKRSKGRDDDVIDLTSD